MNAPTVLLDYSSSAFSGTYNTGATSSPASGKDTYAIVSVFRGVGVGDAAIVGMNADRWIRMSDVLDGSHRLIVFKAQGSALDTTQITLTMSGGTHNAAQCVVVQTDPAEFRQAVRDTATSTSATVAMGSYGAATNQILMITRINSNTVSITPDGTLTQLTETADVSDALTVNVSWDDATDTTPSKTLGSSIAWSAVCIELEPVSDAPVIVAAGSAASGTSVASSSWTPSGAAVYAIVRNRESTSIGGIDTPTVSGNGLTWTMVTTGGSSAGGAGIRVSLFAGTGSGSAGATTATFVDTQTNPTIVVLEWDGRAPVIQSDSDGDFAASPGVTLSAFAGPQNATLFAWSPEGDRAMPTALNGLRPAGMINSIFVYYLAGEDTTPGMTFSGTTDWGAVGALIAAIPVSADRIDLQWSNVADETGYRVERSPDGTTGWTNVSGSIPANVLVYADTGLVPTTTYWYRVFAFNASGDSDPSNVVSATTLASVAGGSGAVYTPTYAIALVRRTPQSATAPTLVEVGPLVAAGLAWSDELNRDGMATLSVKTQTMTAAVKSAIGDMLASLTTNQIPGFEVWIYRDGVFQWAGPVVHLRLQPNQVGFTCRGLMYYLRWMWIKYADLTYTGVDQYTIAAGLVDHWQDETYGNYGIDTSGVGLSGVTRTRSYLTADNHNAYERIIELGDVANGFDITIDPSTRALLLESPKGTDRTATVVIDKRNVVNAQAEVIVSADAIASEAFATSPDAALEATASNTTVRQSFGRAGMAMAFDGITVSGTLANKATKLLAPRTSPLFLPPAEVRPVVVNGVVTFDINGFASGDTIAIAYDFGFGMVSAEKRVLGKFVRVDEVGRERVGVTFE